VQVLLVSQKAALQDVVNLGLLCGVPQRVRLCARLIADNEFRSMYALQLPRQQFREVR